MLAGARTRLAPPARERLRAIARGRVRWDRVLALADAHGVLSLLHHQLATAVPDGVPEATLAELRERMLQHAGRTLVLGHELAALLDDLASRGLPALPYKGPALAMAIYGGMTLRAPGDLDVVVAPDQIADARAVLLERGYRDALPGVAPDARVAHYQHGMVRDADQVHVELHWAFAPRYFRFGLRPEDLAHEPLRLAGRTVRTIAPADLLLVLSVHGGRHLWSRLLWIADLAELLRARPEAPWGDALARADRLGVRRHVLVGLALAHDLLEAELPGPLADAVGADPAARALARRLAAPLFREGGDPPALVGTARLHLAMRERWRDRVAYAILGPLTPSEHDAPALAGRLGALRWLARPLGLVRRHGLVRRSRPRPTGPPTAGGRHP